MGATFLTAATTTTSTTTSAIAIFFIELPGTTSRALLQCFATGSIVVCLLL